ncbi:hypothetical protein EVAR_17137_1 [Eumeta japonica]|uniref:Uncharacterized protein n=1 Tax=Eumeta variegata TaxID=151549 RepID=A0A4C1ULY1_EUMVA|nr:hypothetical protein EVAR_17137_1 [Eumeta japonica]
MIAGAHICCRSSRLLVSEKFSNFGTKFLTAGLEEIGILLRDRTEKNVIVKPERQDTVIPSGPANTCRLSAVKLSRSSPATPTPLYYKRALN